MNANESFATKTWRFLKCNVYGFMNIHWRINRHCSAENLSTDRWLWIVKSYEYRPFVSSGLFWIQDATFSWMNSAKHFWRSCTNKACFVFIQLTKWRQRFESRRKVASSSRTHPITDAKSLILIASCRSQKYNNCIWQYVCLAANSILWSLKLSVKTKSSHKATTECTVRRGNSCTRNSRF